MLDVYRLPGDSRVILLGRRTTATVSAPFVVRAFAGSVCCCRRLALLSRPCDSPLGQGCVSPSTKAPALTHCCGCRGAVQCGGVDFWGSPGESLQQPWRQTPVPTDPMRSHRGGGLRVRASACAYVRACTCGFGCADVCGDGSDYVCACTYACTYACTCPYAFGCTSGVGLPVTMSVHAPAFRPLHVLVRWVRCCLCVCHGGRRYFDNGGMWVRERAAALQSCSPQKAGWAF